MDAFLTGFYEVIPRQLISMFNEQELELLISGLPEVDIDDLANNTEYKSYTKTSPQVKVDFYCISMIVLLVYLRFNGSGAPLGLLSRRIGLSSSSLLLVLVK